MIADRFLAELPMNKGSNLLTQTAGRRTSLGIPPKSPNDVERPDSSHLTLNAKPPSESSSDSEGFSSHELEPSPPPSIEPSPPPLNKGIPSPPPSAGRRNGNSPHSNLPAAPPLRRIKSLNDMPSKKHSPYSHSPCPNDACNVMVSTARLQEHIAICPRQEIQCTIPGCGEVMPREQLQMHAKGQKHQTLVREAVSRAVRDGDIDVATALTQVLTSTSIGNCRTFGNMTLHTLADRRELTGASTSNEQLSMPSDSVPEGDAVNAEEKCNQIDSPSLSSPQRPTIVTGAHALSRENTRGLAPSKVIRRHSEITAHGKSRCCE